MTTPRIRRVLETALYCRDLAVTAAFYRSLFPAPALRELDRLIALDAGDGSVLLLFPEGGATGALDIPGGRIPGHDGRAGGHVAFAIDAASYDSWRERLDALGIAIESEVSWELGGRSLYVRDPDDRSVEFATPGTWSVY